MNSRGCRAQCCKVGWWSGGPKMVVWGEIMIQNNCQVRAAAAAATINAQSAIILIDNMSSMATWSSSGNCKEDQRRRDQVRRMFNKADKNKDGKLTPEEWRQVLNSSGVPTSMEEVEEFFERMDRDFDGRLSFEEFMGEESPIEKLFKNMDKNGDGVVTKQEFMTICKNLTDEQVKVAFAKFDTSGDDKLDYREFCDMINKRNEED